MASGLILLLFLGIGGNMFGEALAANNLIICEHSTVQLTCAPRFVISILSVDYGRHDKTTCSAGRPPSQLQDTSCSTTSGVVASNCNGRNSCSVTASNDVFGDPCFGTFKYLTVIFKCRFRFFPRD